MQTLTPFAADLLFWVAVAACCIAEIAIIRSVIRAPLSQASALPRVRRAPEVFWAIVPAVGLVVLFVFTWYERQG